MVPPQNYLNLYRLLVWFLLANLAFKKGYTDIIHERKLNPISGKKLEKHIIKINFIKYIIYSGITLLEILINL